MLRKTMITTAVFFSVSVHAQDAVETSSNI